MDVFCKSFRGLSKTGYKIFLYIVQIKAILHPFLKCAKFLNSALVIQAIIVIGNATVGSAVGAGDAAASPSKNFLGKIDWFGQIWLLGEIKAKFGQNWSEIWKEWLDLGKT